MALAPNTPSTTLPATAAEDDDGHQTARLELKPSAPATGHVDGAWWPRSRNLAVELPALAAELAGRIGPVERLSYNLTAWSATARKVTVDGAIVRLEGFRAQHPDTVDVLGAQQRLTLLVVPPEASPQAAQRALLEAGQPGNTDNIEELLTPVHVAPAGRTHPRRRNRRRHAASGT